MSKRGLAIGLLVPLLLVLETGCGGAGKTKAGVAAPHTITLVMQVPDAEDPGAAFFEADVARRTHGRIRIVTGADYPSTFPDNERRLARALRSGKVELAYVTSRAWERAGVSGFQALQAPFLIRDYTTLRRIVEGPIGARMLARLDDVGLVGLGLVPDELRRPLGRRPLVDVAAFRGARIRVITSPTSELDLRTIGAVPVTTLDAHTTFGALQHGRLDGVESSTLFIESNGYAAAANFLPRNLALFAKAETIVMGKRSFEQLTPADQAALRAAATATVSHADPAAEERTETLQLCRQGALEPVLARKEDILALRRASAPAYAQLERDARTKRAIADIERLQRDHPPSTAAAVLPSCPARGTRREASGRTSTFPTGTYETRITMKDLRGTGWGRSFAHWERVTFRPNGTWWDVWFHPRTRDQPPVGGHYFVNGNVIRLVPANPDTLRWSYYRGMLTFKIIDVSDAFARFTYTVHPWRKVN